MVEGGFEEEVQLIKEKQQREAGEFQGAPGWGRASKRSRVRGGIKSGSFVWTSPGRVLKT